MTRGMAPDDRFTITYVHGRDGERRLTGLHGLWLAGVTLSTPWHMSIRLAGPRCSPATLAHPRLKEMRTPLLIMYSDDDPRCPIAQAKQRCVVLKQQRRDVRFVRFPRENRESSRNGKPGHRLQRANYPLDFFAEPVNLSNFTESEGNG